MPSLLVIPVESALAIVLEQTPRLDAERVGLREALGRVLREDVSADADMPAFDRSAMDGFAVRAEELVGAPVTLPVAGEIRAGEFPEAPLPPGKALRIMTGAPLPPGADAVQPVEKTRAAGEAVELLEPVAVGAHIARRGSEVAAGDRVLSTGERLDPAAIAVLASVGCGRVAVGRRPRVAVLVTGDELVDVDVTPRGGQIRNANGYALEQQVRRAGAEPVPLGVAGDSRERIAEAMRPGFDCDVLAVSGGVSAGLYDLVEDVFASFGVEVFFDAVAIKPGKPLVFGRRGSALVFGLPGNPVSAQVAFDVFARPALLKMQGARLLARPVLEVELLAPLKNRSRRRAHLPALVRFEGARAVAEPIVSRGSADVVAHARANALLVLAADKTEAAAGERVSALLLDSFLERGGTHD